MTNQTSRPVSRLAPSPTGALHLGNVRTFLINRVLATQNGWRLPMRMEDLDGPRVKPESITAIYDALAWLGIEWDGAPLTQTDDLSPYRDAMQRLAAAGRVYRCRRSRKDIQHAASAPQSPEHDVVFPIELRPPDAPHATFDRDDVNYRCLVDDRAITVDDRIHGAYTDNLMETIGDFIVWTKRGTPSYQLAVVVDDLRQGVTDVVRGDDLLPSAARQTALYEALGHAPPTWWHVPLVLGEDGRRLAKRHGDTRITMYREAGVSVERLIGLLAAWSGIPGPRRPMTLDDFARAFEIDRLPRGAVVFRQEDDAWLRASD